MNVYVSQVYPEAGASYPFTHRFQRFVSKAITDRITSSDSFVRKYGEDFDLIFRMSAKSGIQNTEIKGPTVFKRDKDVEYTIFLPYRDNGHDPNILSNVVASLLSAIVFVLNDLGFDASNLLRDSRELAAHIAGDLAMTS